MDPDSESRGAPRAPCVLPTQNRKEEEPAHAPAHGGIKDFAEELGRLVALALTAEDESCRNRRIGVSVSIASSLTED